MSRRHYVNNAAVTTLSSLTTASATSLTVADASTFPATFPWAAVINAGNPTAEVVLVTAASGNVLTVTRAYDSTSAQTHQAGEAFGHAAIAEDYDEANSHVNATANVHGVAGTIVGTTDVQTLSGKTLTAPHLTSPVVDSGGLTVTAGGVAVTGNSTVTGTFHATGNATIDGTLTVGGAAPLSPTGDVEHASGSSTNLGTTGGPWHYISHDAGSLFNAGGVTFSNSALGSPGWVVPATGLYAIFVRGNAQINSGGTVVKIGVGINGATPTSRDTVRVDLGSTSDDSFGCTIQVPLSAGDRATAFAADPTPQDINPSTVTPQIGGIYRVA